MRGHLLLLSPVLRYQPAHFGDIACDDRGSHGLRRESSKDGDERGSVYSGCTAVQHSMRPFHKSDQGDNNKTAAMKTTREKTALEAKAAAAGPVTNGARRKLPAQIYGRFHAKETRPEN